MNDNQVFCESLFREASPEFRLVAACCAAAPEEERSYTLQQLLRQPFRPERVLSLSDRHRVTGLVFQSLRQESTVPRALADQLAKHAGRIARSNLVALRQAAVICKAFEREAIPFLILKGAPLAQLAYDDLCIRHSKDIDLLIAARDAPRAQLLLQQLQFKAASLADGLDEQQTKLWTRYRKHTEFVHRELGVRLELHWRAFDNHWLGEPDDPAASREWIHVGDGLRLPALPQSELLLHLCAHGATHAWFRMKWLADVDRLLCRSSPGAAGELLSQSQKRGLERTVEQALLLRAALFGHVDGLDGLETSVTSRWLARVSRDALLANAGQSTSSEADFVPRRLKTARLLLRHGWAYRREEFLIHIFAPVDFHSFPLPPQLQFLYPFLRLPLWIKRRWFTASRR